MKKVCVLLVLVFVAGCAPSQPAGIFPEQELSLGHPAPSVDEEIAAIEAEVAEHNKTVPDTGPLVEVTGKLISLSCTPAMDSSREYPTSPTVLNAEEYAALIRPLNEGKSEAASSITMSAPHVRLGSGQRKVLSLLTKGSYVADYEKLNGFWIPRLNEYPANLTLLDVSAEVKDGAVVFKKVNFKAITSTVIQVSGSARIGGEGVKLTWGEPLIHTQAASLDPKDGILLADNEYLFLPLQVTVERAASNLRAIMSDRDIRDDYAPAEDSEKSSSVAFLILNARIVNEDVEEE